MSGEGPVAEFVAEASAGVRVSSKNQSTGNRLPSKQNATAIPSTGERPVTLLESTDRAPASTSEELIRENQRLALENKLLRENARLASENAMLHKMMETNQAAPTAPSAPTVEYAGLTLPVFSMVTEQHQFLQQMSGVNFVPPPRMQCIPSASDGAFPKPMAADNCLEPPSRTYQSNVVLVPPSRSHSKETASSSRQLSKQSTAHQGVKTALRDTGGNGGQHTHPHAQALLSRQAQVAIPVGADHEDTAGFTTVMFRNLPNTYNRELVRAMLDSEGFAGKYDFLYLPIDFKTNACLGYAFINLIDHEAADRFWKAFHGYSSWMLPSKKVAFVTWSGPHQGRDAHIERYRDSPVMHSSVPEQCKPLVLENGVPIPFPAPNKKPKAPRFRN